MMGVLIRASVVVLGLLLSSCANRYGAPVTIGQIVVDSDNKQRQVYFISDRDYRREIEPQLRAGSAAVLPILDRLGSPFPAQGQTIAHNEGNYRMVYLCGEAVRNQLVQVILASERARASNYRADCNW